MSLKLEDFSKYVKVLEEDYRNLEDAVKKVTKQNPFISDGYGVQADWLSKVFEHSVFNLVKAVKPEANDEAVVDFFNYALYECGLKERSLFGSLLFGGTIEVGSKEYHLENIEDVYDYIRDQL